MVTRSMHKCTYIFKLIFNQMKFVFLILLSSDTVGTNIAQYIVSCFFSCFPWLCYIKRCFNVLIHFFSATALSWRKKNLHFNFSLIFSIIEGKKLWQFSQSYHNVHFRTYGGYLYWDAFLWHFKNCSVLVCTFFAA